jgi:hypothetical protein
MWEHRLDKTLVVTLVMAKVCLCLEDVLAPVLEHRYNEQHQRNIEYDTLSHQHQWSLSLADMSHILGDQYHWAQ